MRYLLDTSVAIELRDNKPRALDAVGRLPALPFLSVVSRVELEGGVYAKPFLGPQRRALLDTLLKVIEIIPFDDEMAAAYGGICAQHGFSRRKSLDRMIAATAIVRELTLVTLNGADFEDVSGLELEVWNP